MNQGFDLPAEPLSDIFARTFQEAQKLIGAERGLILLQNEEGLLDCHAALGLRCEQWGTKRCRFAQKLAAQVMKEQQTRLTSDAQVDQRPDIAQSMGIQSILCAPLASHNQSVGVIYVERRLTGRVFTVDDLDILETIALYTALEIESAKRNHFALEMGRDQGATEMAESLLLSLLPQKTPQIPNFDIAARWQSATLLAADFYDFFPLIERKRWGMIVADVSERGSSAVLLMALTRSIIRGSLNAASGPVIGIQQANRLIYADTNGKRYVQACYAELDQTGMFYYINAAYPAPLLWRASTTSVTVLSAQAVKLGTQDEFSPRIETIKLEAGDVLLFGSDGLFELSNPKGSSFGQERLIGLLHLYASLSASAIASAILEEAQLWMRRPMPDDDLLLMVVKYTTALTPGPSGGFGRGE